MENAIMNLNDMPITMDEPQQPAHAVHHALIDTLLSQFTKHIDMLVETKFNAMLANRNALNLMDDEMFKRIEVMIDYAITEHEGSNVHNDSDDVERIAADTARETLKEYASKQEGWVTSDQVNDLITERVDEELDNIDWDEKVKDVLREML
jgi:SOS response regulatory protein OraA/RecX